jgi:glycosyltransferase involved in cell wall biosynthesis
MSSESIPRLCILNVEGYPLYNPKCKSFFGGAEVQCYLLAKGLAETGKFDVSVVVSDHGQQSLEIYDAVRVYPHSGYRHPGSVLGSPLAVLRWWLRRLKRASSFRLQKKKTWYIGDFPMSSSRLAIYDELDVQIYVARWNAPWTAELAFSCNQRGIPFVFLAATPGDYTEPTKARPEQKYVVEKAALHIVQTQIQSEALWKYYQRPSVKIPSLIDDERRFPKETKPQTILWVGKVNEIKRPELALVLAQELPEYQFVLIAHGLGNEYYRCHIEPILGDIENITWIEYVPYRQIEAYFARAKLFVSTSAYEGFPNTFLQAAKYGVPIISLQVDPAGLLSSHGCGVACGGDLDQMKENIRLLMETPEIYIRFSDNCTEYLCNHHDNRRIIRDYELAIESVLKGSTHG